MSLRQRPRFRGSLGDLNANTKQVWRIHGGSHAKRGAPASIPANTRQLTAAVGNVVSTSKVTGAQRIE